MFTTKSNDSELWLAITKSDLKAFNVLFDRYWSSIYTTAFSYLKDPEASSEITHDIFLNIWNKRSELDIQSFKGYLTASARYHVYKRKKTIKSINIQYIEDYESLEAASVQNSGDEKVSYMELENKVDSFLNELPSRCREIFILSRKEHLSNDEIAQRLCISKRTVENQLTSALKYLRMSLRNIGIILIILHL